MDQIRNDTRQEDANEIYLRQLKHQQMIAPVGRVDGAEAGAFAALLQSGGAIAAEAQETAGLQQMMQQRVGQTRAAGQRQMAAGASAGPDLGKTGKSAGKRASSLPGAAGSGMPAGALAVVQGAGRGGRRHSKMEQSNEADTAVPTAMMNPAAVVAWMPTPAAAVTPQGLVAAAPQTLEYATLSQNVRGEDQLELGLSPQLLGGMKVRLVSHGQGRISLRLSGDKAPAGEKLAELVERLREKGLEVVQIEREG